MFEEQPNNPLVVVGAVVVIALAGMVAWSSLHEPAGRTGAVYVDAAVTARLGAEPPGPEVSMNALPAVKTTEPGMLPFRSVDAVMAALLQALSSPRAVPNEAVLTFRTRQAMKDFLRQASQHGLRVIGSVDGLHAVRVGFDDARSLRNYLSSAGADKPAVEANYWMVVPRLPKEDATNQGGVVPVGGRLFSDINAAGDRSQWGRGVTVAVLDTGVKAHPTFGETQVMHLDLVNDGKAFHSHGTSVASLIAGQDEQAPGVAPAASILDIRIADDKGYSVTSLVAQGIVEAVDRGVTLINISMGGYDDSGVLRQAVAYAASKGVPIFAAAGNDGYNQLAYPAAIPSVIAVGSVAGDDKQAYFSNSGSNLDLTAPGVGLITAWDVNKIASVSGTSQSSAVAAGAAAATASFGYRADTLESLLKQNARTTGASQDKIGAGVIQLPAH